MMETDRTRKLVHKLAIAMLAVVALFGNVPCELEEGSFSANPAIGVRQYTGTDGKPYWAVFLKSNSLDRLDFSAATNQALEASSREFSKNNRPHEQR